MSNAHHQLTDLNSKAPSTSDRDQSPDYADLPPQFPETSTSTSENGTSSLPGNSKQETRAKLLAQRESAFGNSDRMYFCLTGALFLLIESISVFLLESPGAQISSILTISFSIFLFSIAGAIVFRVDTLVGERKFITGIAYGFGFTHIFLIICMLVKLKINQGNDDI